MTVLDRYLLYLEGRIFCEDLVAGGREAITARRDAALVRKEKP